MKKEILEKYLEVSNLLGIELRSVVPWSYLLPKYLDINEPAIILSKLNDEQVVVLSELGGVFFADVFKEDKSADELEKIVEELSVYKRNDPIKKVYSLNYETLDLGDTYDSHKVDVPGSDLGDPMGFEVNMLVNYMLDMKPDLFASQGNLLSLLPVPVVERKSEIMVYAGAFTAAIVLVGLIVGGVMYSRVVTRLF